MKKADIEKLKDNFYIYSNGEYVVLPGRKLYILRTDGSLVACRSDLRYARKIAFLSAGRMLLCANKTFHMINLCDGCDIWSTPYTKTELNIPEIAISPDEEFAYTYDSWKGRNFICRLNLLSQKVEIHELVMDSGATRDILCDEDGIFCMLKTLHEAIGGIEYCQSGVRIHDYYRFPDSTNQWKTKWSFPVKDHLDPLCFYNDTDHILTHDFHVYAPATGELYNLLENERDWQFPARRPSSCWLDPSKQYLCVMFYSANVVIDIHARKVVAQYAATFHQGCLVGNEYWICVENRILRKPFPAFEEISPVKTSLVPEEYYSKHPELW